MGYHVTAMFILFIFSKLSSGFSTFQSWKSPTASSSTEHRAAAGCICSIDSSSSCRFGFFFPVGGSVFLFGEMIAGNSSCDDLSDGLSEGRGGVRARLEGCALSADWDLGRGILYGRQYFCNTGVKEGPFVGEETAIIFLEVEKVVEVVEVVVKIIQDLNKSTTRRHWKRPQKLKQVEPLKNKKTQKDKKAGKKIKSDKRLNNSRITRTSDKSNNNKWFDKKSQK